MALDFSIRTIIEQKISEIENEYQQTQGLILTEDDLKCLFYDKLIKIPELSQRIKTEDQEIYAKPIHAEVSWYDKNNKLTIKPDITILEPEHLSILHRYGCNLRLPSKNYSFNGKAIIFELKFIRNKIGITPRTFSSKIMKDYRKIQVLFERLDSQGYSHHVFCYFIIFNKTNIKCKEFDLFIEQNGQSNRHKIIYGTGNVQFKNRNVPQSATSRD
jgi:hypothetical protein